MFVCLYSTIFILFVLIISADYAVKTLTWNEREAIRLHVSYFSFPNHLFRQTKKLNLSINNFETDDVIMSFGHARSFIYIYCSSRSYIYRCLVLCLFSQFVSILSLASFF